MSNKLKRKKNQTESFLTTFYRFLKLLMDYITGLYMLLIIVVMPLYFQREQGYRNIGTSKYLFFRWTLEHIGILLLPVLACYGICAGFYFHKETDGGVRGALRTWRKSLNCVDIFAMLYGLSVVVSYACSSYRDVALWGAVGWYMGLVPQLASVAVYFCISRCWNRRDWMFLLFLSVSALVFLLGVLNRFGVYPINMQLELSSFISTIGNINWYCGYLVCVLFAGVYLLWQKEEIAAETLGEPGSLRWRARAARILLVLYVAIGFAALVTQGSQSGFLALGIALLVLFALSAGDGRRMQMFWEIVLVLGVTCGGLWGVRTAWPDAITFQDGIVDLFTDSFLPAGMIVLAGLFLVVVCLCNRRGNYPVRVFRVLGWMAVCGTIVSFATVVGMIIWNTRHPGSLGALSDNSFFTFSPTWGSNRGATWRAGWMCLREESLLQRLFGVGPDGMEAFINDQGSEELRTLIAERFPGMRLTNAHSEWLTICINMGFFGAISFAGMMLSAIISFLRSKKGQAVIAGACGLCVLTYTVNNLVSFQQSMSLATIFVVLGIGRAYLRVADVEGM